MHCIYYKTKLLFFLIKNLDLNPNPNYVCEKSKVKSKVTLLWTKFFKQIILSCKVINNSRYVITRFRENFQNLKYFYDAREKLNRSNYNFSTCQ